MFMKIEQNTIFHQLLQIVVGNLNFQCEIFPVDLLSPVAS